MKHDVIIIGGGFFGTYLARHLKSRVDDIVIFEQGDKLLGRASYGNQARVHGGYHYPRSIVTGARSKVSYPRFMEEFSVAVSDRETHYYMIAKQLSKVSSRQFRAFCNRIKAPLEPANDFYANHCAPQYVDAAFKVEEAVFDAVELRRLMQDGLKQDQIEVALNHTVQNVERHGKNLRVTVQNKDEKTEIHEAPHVFCCIYSELNELRKRCGLELLPLKHEFTEVCLIEPPEFLKSAGITVMCGPFFSALPFPSINRHSFTHVRYTPHQQIWDTTDNEQAKNANLKWLDTRRSHYNRMLKDAVRYLPEFEEARYVDSVWETKTVLAASELNDSRPILFEVNAGLDGFHCILGGKIDNVFDMIEIFERLGEFKNIG